MSVMVNGPWNTGHTVTLSGFYSTADGYLVLSWVTIHFHHNRLQYIFKKKKKKTHLKQWPWFHPGKSDNSSEKGPCWGCTNTNNSEMCRTFLSCSKEWGSWPIFPQWTMNTFIILGFRATVAIISHEKSFPPPAASNLKTSVQPRRFAFSRARTNNNVLTCRPLSV